MRNRLFLIVFLFSFSSVFGAFKGWTHLELGAGNYGQNGRSLRGGKEQPVEACYVRSEEHFFWNQNEKTFAPEKQYFVLFETLDQLITRFGPEGIFHVNDYVEDFTLYTAFRLKEYAVQKGYSQVTIEAVIGDFGLVDPIRFLAKYGKKRYDSVHLKSPEPGLYFPKSGRGMQPSEEDRQNTRDLLQKMANYGTEGLYFFTLYNDRFIPPAEQKEYFEQGIFYRDTAVWEPVPYYHPNGRVMTARTEVFFIENSE